MMMLSTADTSGAETHETLEYIFEMANLIFSWSVVFFFLYDLGCAAAPELIIF